MVKLNKKGIQEVISKKKQGFSSKYLANGLGISTRRVQQIFKQYLLTGAMPELKKERRPSVQLTEEQKQLIEEVYQRERVGARLLKLVLDQDYPYNKISKNKIHAYLVERKYTQPDKKKQAQRKRTRYERKHSGSLAHIDTHYCKWNPNLKLIAVEDDASRCMLSAGEFSTTNAQLAIKVMKQAVAQAWEYRVLIRAVNSDRGSEFFANKEGRKKSKRHDFLSYLDSQAIKHIPSRVKNPQTNGKLERWFQEYEKHRPRFESLEAFVAWYNNRIQGELRTRPALAFRNKLRPESLLGLFFKEDDYDAKKY